MLCMVLTCIGQEATRSVQISQRLLYFVVMSTDPEPSGRDRRHHFRMTVVLPANIQLETDTGKSALTEQSINISGGGIGFVSDVPHNHGDILTITLLLHEQVLFKVQAEVLRREPLAYRPQASRIHARFIQISEQEREVLIRYIMRLQREHLHGHYSA
jgi:c-di-GMP-binding flagellar brake protein YcgR